ncbi:MAG: DUF1622 domain-containing protein [Oscillospiraceae bacterium]|jgi:uncharacterized membrane protein|nr:DUF1622 domain-containing protein [Oscillospiraceae bacterium]
MPELLELFEHGFSELVQLGVVLLELVGVVVLLVTTARCIISLLKRRGGVRLTLAEGIALALEFKLGGEVLRTVIVRQWNELLILGAIIVLRGALTFLIHWEIKNEKAHLDAPKKHDDQPDADTH